MLVFQNTRWVAVVHTLAILCCFAHIYKDPDKSPLVWQERYVTKDFFFPVRSHKYGRKRQDDNDDDDDDYCYDAEYTAYRAAADRYNETDSDDDDDYEEGSDSDEEDDSESEEEEDEEKEDEAKAGTSADKGGKQVLWCYSQGSSFKMLAFINRMIRLLNSAVLGVSFK